jgi:hypothetical protein
VTLPAIPGVNTPLIQEETSTLIQEDNPGPGSSVVVQTLYDR